MQVEIMKRGEVAIYRVGNLGIAPSRDGIEVALAIPGEPVYVVRDQRQRTLAARTEAQGARRRLALASTPARPPIAEICAAAMPEILFPMEIAGCGSPATPASSPAPEIPAVTITPREHEVMALVAQGRTNKEIAQALGASAHTVKFHLVNAAEKLGAKNRAHVAAMFVRQQMAAEG